MKKLMAMIGLMGLTSGTPQFAHGAVSFGIFISNAPPPPPVVFVHQPRFVLVPEEQVYYCDDDYSNYDVFRYGSFFYLYDDGYWYRASNYRGPFVAIRIEYVPRSVFYVSDYGYRWRQAPRWGSRAYSHWNASDRRFRDWRSPRYSNWRDGRHSDSNRRDIRERQDRRYAQATPRDDREDVRDRRDSRNRHEDGDDKKQGGGNGRGHGRGNGKGNGRGHGGDDD